LQAQNDDARKGSPDLARQELLTAERFLNARFFERADEVRGLILALLAREHVLLLGPPGAAKSELADALCSLVGGPYFYALLTRTSTPEDLFGPVSIKALEQDSYRRKTAGYLPSARVAFVDEVFKASSAVLNGLLSVLNERVFVNDGAREELPLETLVAASNELPAEREELGAIWDRFMLRFEVSYLKGERDFAALLGRAARVPDGGWTGPGPAPSGVGPEALGVAREAARAVDASPLVGQLVALRRELEEAGISASDRRWARSLALLKANAFLEGRAQATDEDLAPLAHVLWGEPSQRREVRKKVLARANPFVQKARELLDEAEEIHLWVMGVEEHEEANAGNEANTKLKRITNSVLDLKTDAQNAGRDASKIDDALVALDRMKKEVLRKCFSMDL
jgi:MoxR-like ATPase